MLTADFINKFSMLKGVFIRTAAPADLEQLQALYLYNDEIETELDVRQKDGFEQTIANGGIKGTPDKIDNILVLSRCDNKILGYVNYDMDSTKKSVEIKSIVIEEALQNKGYGCLLMMYTLHYINANNGHLIELIAKGDSLKFYTGIGFTHYKLQNHGQWQILCEDEQKVDDFCNKYGGTLIFDASSILYWNELQKKLWKVFSQVIPMSVPLSNQPIIDKDYLYHPNIQELLSGVTYSLDRALTNLKDLIKVNKSSEIKPDAITARIEEIYALNSQLIKVIDEIDSRLMRSHRYTTIDVHTLNDMLFSNQQFPPPHRLHSSRAL